MKNISSLFLFLFSFLVTVNAQDKNLLEAEGKIPKEFITPSTVKFKKEMAALNKKKEKRKNKKNKKQFLLESGFAIDDILQSGRVLFNDPASVYVNKVLAKLPIKGERKLTKKKPRAYILNSAAVNAFATDQGIIFVTLGLLANLENEAQLAFILSHELVHIKHRHAINKFVKSKDIDRTSRRGRNVGKIGLDKNIFRKSMYSRKLEEEADEEGLDIFLKSEYDPQAILNTFKILHYSYLPYDEVPFEKSFFEDANYILNEDLWLDEVKAVSAIDNHEEDEHSSHPSSIKRMEKLESSIPAKDGNTKSAFLLPEADFKNIRERARNQIPYLNLYSENFPQSIYTSYLGLKEQGDNIELQKVIGKSLYMESKYRNYYEENNSSEEYEEIMEEIVGKIEGESQRVYHLLSSFNTKELNILALKYNWKVFKQNEEDPEMIAIMDDCFKEFASHFQDLKTFSKIALSESIEEEAPEKIDEEMTKLDKVEKSNKRKKYWKYAFVEELKEDKFKAAFDKGVEAYEKSEEKSEYYDSREGRKEWNKEQLKEEKKGKKLGIKKVVVVNPFYLSLDDRKENSVQYIRSEEKQAYFRKSLKDIAKISKVKTTVLDVTDLSTRDIEKFNDIAQVNNYMSQQMDQYDLSLTPGYNQNEVDAIADKYGTDYFLWTGVISLREKRPMGLYIFYSILLPVYSWPFTFPKMIKPEYDMLYYAMLFDVKTGRRSIIKMDYFDKRDSKTTLKSHIYDVFHQIGTTEK